MKRTLKILIPVIALCLILSGCAVDRLNAGAYKTGSVTLEDEIHKIDIDWPSGNVIVTGGGKGGVSIKQGRDSGDGPAYRLLGSTLYIKAAVPGKEAHTGDLTVHIPTGIKLNEIELRCETAQVTFVNVTAKRADILTSGGDVKLVSCTVTDEAEIGTDDGNIDVSGKIKDYDIQTLNGGVKIKAPEAPAELTVQSVKGSVALTLPADAQFRLKAVTEGIIANEFEEGRGATYKITSESGNITVNKSV